MDLFTRLFGDLLVFVYHCFDRIVIHGYLGGLSRPEQVVHFFRAAPHDQDRPLRRLLRWSCASVTVLGSGKPARAILGANPAYPRDEGVGLAFQNLQGHGARVEHHVVEFLEREFAAESSFRFLS